LVNKVAGAGSSVDFICGIFKNDKLVALRPDGITAIDTAPTQSIFTLNYTEENVPTGNYTVDVACRKISSSDVANNYFRIGVNIPTYGPAPILNNTSSNAFSLRSYLKSILQNLLPISIRIMKKTLIFSITLISTLLCAQGNVGVATTNPRSNLDVNGDLNIGKKLYLDNGTGTLVPGSVGQVLVSRGPECFTYMENVQNSGIFNE
jgi:hypothetical protein